MTIRKTGEWNEARRITSTMKERFTRAKGIAVAREAHRFRAAVVETFNSSGTSAGDRWEPLKASTIANKKVGGSKPLIARGDLRNSVVVVKRAGSAWVGVKSKKTTKNGARMTDIAAVHEFGKIIVIPMTPKMLRFLAARARENGQEFGNGGGGSAGGGKIIIVRIPKRSFLNSTFNYQYKRHPQAARARILADMANELGPGWEA